MTHLILLAAFVAVSRTAPDLWTLTTYPALIVATFAVSVFSHFAIEVPARNAISGRQRVRPAPIVR